MADVTVKQLAQVVGIPVERLLNQLQEAGLSFSDDHQTVNEDQKRILLNYLKGNSAREVSVAPERITLRKKSMSQVTVGHDSHTGKTVNIEVRKKKTFVKRSSIVEPAEIEEKLEEQAQPVIEDKSQEIDISVAEEVASNEGLNLEAIQEETIEVSTVEEINVAPSEQLPESQEDNAIEAQEEQSSNLNEPAVEQDLSPKAHKEEKHEKPAKKKHSDITSNESDGDFKKVKKKPKYQNFEREDEEQEGSHRGSRNKFKKRKNHEKSDRYREAEETLTHGFAEILTNIVSPPQASGITS